MRTSRSAALGLTVALALSVAAPAHAAGTFRNDDGTRESAIHVDYGDGRDYTVAGFYLPGRSVHGSTGARVWLYGMATDCDVAGAGHRLDASWFGEEFIDYDPCAIFPTDAFAWHAFDIPKYWLLDGAFAYVHIEDLDDGLLPLPSGHDAQYGVDIDNTSVHTLYQDDAASDGQRRVDGVLMAYIELTGSVPKLFGYPWRMTFSTRDTGTTSAAQTETVQNIGLEPTTVSVSITGPAAGDFAVASSSCNGTLQPGGPSCTVSFAFTPSAPGSRYATATISGTGGTGPLVVELHGEGRGGPPTSTFTTPDGALLLQTDTVHGTVTGISDVKTEHVTFTPDDPVRATVMVSAELSCTSGTSCSWSTDALLLPGRYAVTASGTDRQGNVEFPGPSITVTVI